MQVFAASIQKTGELFLHAGYSSAWGTDPDNPDGQILLIAGAVGIFLIVNYVIGSLVEKSQYKMIVFRRLDGRASLFKIQNYHCGWRRHCCSF